MIRRSFLGQEPKRMLSDQKPDPYREVRRKPKRPGQADDQQLGPVDRLVAG